MSIAAGTALLVLLDMPIASPIGNRLHGPRQWFLLIAGIGMGGIPALCMTILSRLRGSPSDKGEGGTVDEFVHLRVFTSFPCSSSLAWSGPSSSISPGL